MRTFIITAIFLTANFFSFAQEQPDLVTDRPDQTESANIVPLKSLQIETGALIEWIDSDNKTITFNSTLLRYGLAQNLELRFGVGNSMDIVSQNGEDIEHNYWQPVEFGFKVFITEQNGCIPQTAFLGSLTYQVDNNGNGFDADFISPSFRFAFANDINETVSLGYNLGMHWDILEEGTPQKASLYYSFVTGFSLTDNLGCFAEIYGDISDDQPNPLLFDTGFTYLIKNNLQLDLSGGLGLNKNAPDGFISAGLSWRIPQ